MGGFLGQVITTSHDGNEHDENVNFVDNYNIRSLREVHILEQGMVMVIMPKVRKNINHVQELEGGYQGEQRLINCIVSRLRAALASQVGDGHDGHDFCHGDHDGHDYGQGHDRQGGDADHGHDGCLQASLF